jgi:hypothetical protein
MWVIARKIHELDFEDVAVIGPFDSEEAAIAYASSMLWHEEAIRDEIEVVEVKPPER